MTTTLLYVELLVIGAETLSWLILSLFCVIATEDIMKLLTLFNTAPFMFLLLCIIYVLGISFDRIFDLLFKNSESRVKKKYFQNNQEVTYLIWNNCGRSADYNFSMSRKRVLRASIINIPLVTSVLSIYVIKNTYPIFLTIFIIITGCFLFILSRVAYNVLVEDYYKNTKRLKDESKKVK